MNDFLVFLHVETAIWLRECENRQERENVTLYVS